MAAAATSSPFPAPAKVGLKYKKALGDSKEYINGTVLKNIAKAVGVDAVTWDSEADIGVLLAQHAADSSNAKLEAFINGATNFINGATNLGSSTSSILQSWTGGVEHQCKNADVKKAFADAWTTKKVQLRWTKDVEKDVEPGSVIEAKNGASIGLKDGVITLYNPIDECRKTKHESIYLSELLTKAAAVNGSTGLDLAQKKEYAYRGPNIESNLKELATAAGVDKITWDYETDVPAMLAFHAANPGLVNEGGGKFSDRVIPECGSIISSLKNGLIHQFKDPMIKEAFVDAVTNKKIVIKLVKDASTDVSKDSSAMTSKNNGAVQIKDGNFICYQNAKDWSTCDPSSVKIENLL